MIVTGTDLDASTAAVSLAQRHEGLFWATAGLHPHHARDLTDTVMSGLTQLAAEDEVVAVGECGLDYFRDYSPRDSQRRAFEAQLGLAVEMGKPVFLHQRDAHADFTAILAEHRRELAGGVAHCFTGGPAEASAYLELDLYIGVTGWICDERRGDDLRAAVREIPLDRLLVETDAPYLLPRDLRPKPKTRRNEPSYLPHIVDTIAHHSGIDKISLAAATTANAERLFGLSASGRDPVAPD